MPVERICINAILDGGELYTSYHKINMQDKLLIAGILQQDATLDVLKNNGYIRRDEEEDDDE